MSEENHVNSSDPGAGADSTVDAEASSDSSATVSDVGASDASAAPQDPEAERANALEALENELKRVRDQWLRTTADFDNYRKRARREQADAERRARENVLKDLLPVFDNLERASAHTSGGADIKALADGIQMVLKLFGDTLEKLGVERLLPVGQAFDPTQHEAIQHVITSEHSPGTVTAEVQAGYRMGGHLIRPAMVVIAKPPDA